MSLIAKETGGNRQRAMLAEGTHLARCYAIVDLGNHDDTYKGEPRKRRKVILAFEFPQSTHIFRPEDGEQTLTKSKTFTNSLSEKGTLRKMLQSWRGRAFTQEELQGFDLASVTGHPVQVGIIHWTNDSGEKLDIIDSLIACPKGLEIPEGSREPYSYSISEHPKNWDKLAPWMQNEIQNSDEFKALNTSPDQAPEQAESSDCPF